MAYQEAKLLLRYIVYRVNYIILTLWLVSVIVFASTEVLPGDVVVAILGRNAEGPAADALRAQLNLDQPALWRYADWLRGLVTGDLGGSLLLRTPIAPLVAERFGNSLWLAFVPFFVGVPLGVLLGVLSALQQNRWPDYAISIGVMLGIALPEFVIASFAIIVFAHSLNWLPASSLIDPSAGLLANIQFLILPSLVLTLGMLAHVTRMSRASMIDVMATDYIRTAILKGLPLRRVLWHHALRNALVPTVNIVALNVGYLFSGLIVVESVFAYPGLGRLLLQAINSQDLPLLQISVLVITAIYALANLLADLLTLYLNPRLRMA